MRRYLVVTAAVAVLLGSGGCASDSQQPTGSAPTGRATASPPAATPPLAEAATPSPTAAAPATGSAPRGDANTRAVCAEVKRLNTTSSEKINSTLKSFLEKAGRGEQVTEAESNKVLKDMTTLASQWAGKIQQQSAKATDPELRKAVSDLATEVKALTTGNANLQQMGDIVKKSQTDLARFCG